MLHPVGAVVARHHETKWESVEPRQRLAVHLVGEKQIRVGRLVDVDGLQEVRRSGKQRLVEAVEDRLLGRRHETGFRQHVLQADAPPLRVAHRAVGQLAALHARLEETTAVSGALVDRDDLHRLEVLLQLVERQSQRRRDRALDVQAELVGSQLLHRWRRSREMVADKEGVVRRQDSLGEHAERRLQLRRARCQPDQRPLLRILHQRPFAVLKRQRDRLLGEGCDGWKPRDEEGSIS